MVLLAFSLAHTMGNCQNPGFVWGTRKRFIPNTAAYSLGKEKRA